MPKEFYVVQKCVRQGLSGWGVYVVRENVVHGRVAFYTVKGQAELLCSLYNKQDFVVNEEYIEDVK